jgi:transposase
MEQNKATTKIAGVDVGKRWLDVAAHGLEDELRVTNDVSGIGELIAWLRAREVGRVGLEATGGYERQPRVQRVVRLFAKLKRRRAKNDRLDARLIAAATAQVEAVRAARDPRLTQLAERLTAYELITDKAADLKTFLESVTLKDVAATIGASLRSLERTKAKLAAEILTRIKAAPDLLARYRLLLSLPGVGPIVAATLLVRMPELGAMKRGQAASLAGVAPFDRDSGQWKGQRFIQGGRDRPRRMLYLAALQARRCSPTFKTFADNLIARGKPKKLAIVAVMRKLIEAANLILQRGQPWIKQPAT